MSLRPLGDRVVVRRVQETKSAGGLHLPETVKTDAACGEVVAVGPGRVLDGDGGAVSYCRVEKGQRIWFRSTTGTEIFYKGEKYHVLSAIDVLVVEEE